MTMGWHQIKAVVRAVAIAAVAAENPGAWVVVGETTRATALTTVLQLAAVSIDPTVASAGGGRSSGGKFVISGTVGQPGAGPVESGSKLSVAGGFWNLPALVRVAVAVASEPVAVTIHKEWVGVPGTAAGGDPKSVAPAVVREMESLVVSWAADAGGLTLESTTDISGAVPWSVVGEVLPSGDGMNRVRVPFTESQRFFRLRVGESGH